MRKECDDLFKVIAYYKRETQSTAHTLKHFHARVEYMRRSFAADNGEWLNDTKRLYNDMGLDLLVESGLPQFLPSPFAGWVGNLYSAVKSAKEGRPWQTVGNLFLGYYYTAEMITPEYLKTSGSRAIRQLATRAMYVAIGIEIVKNYGPTIRNEIQQDSIMRSLEATEYHLYKNWGSNVMQLEQFEDAYKSKGCESVLGK
jgi:hypothetical protein